MDAHVSCRAVGQDISVNSAAEQVDSKSKVMHKAASGSEPGSQSRRAFAVSSFRCEWRGLIENTHPSGISLRREFGSLRR